MADKWVLSCIAYLEDDDNDVNNLCRLLETEGWLKQNTFVFENSGVGSSPYYYNLQTANIMILMLHQSVDDWQAGMDKIKSYMQTAGLSADDLLAASNILLAVGQDWENTINECQQIVPASQPLDLGLREGGLTRFMGNARVCLAAMPHYNPRYAKFLALKLPVIEAGLVRLQMISSLMRDRNVTVTRERMEIDRRLSDVLHSNLVMEQGKFKAAEDLEMQIHSLSSAYGILNGDYSLLADGRNRLDTALQNLHNMLLNEPALDIKPEVLQELLMPYEQRLQEIRVSLDELRLSRENHQAAIDVVRSRIDIMMSKTNIETQEQIKDLMVLNTSMQKQSLTFQFAAGLIEFIVLAYYGHSLWKNLAHAAYENIPGVIQLVFVLLFAGGTVYCTHLWAEFLQGEHHIKNKVVASTLILLIFLTIIFVASILYSGAH
ncbi:MAG: hypothetical protein ACOX6L_09150 [Syntrophomonadaceae bacterium]|jgi:hypothetical protein